MRIGIAAPRFAAAGVAALAWTGLALQFLATSTHLGSAAKALWFLADYFTVLINFAVAVVFAGIAFGRDDWDRSRLLAGLTLAGLLAATIYALLLRGFDHPYGAGQAATIIMHIAVPILVMLFWLAYVRSWAPCRRAILSLSLSFRSSISPMPWSAAIWKDAIPTFFSMSPKSACIARWPMPARSASAFSSEAMDFFFWTGC